MRDPAAMLGPGLMPTLETVRGRVPLDVFGMDFEVTDDGGVVMFETNAAMVFHPPDDRPTPLMRRPVGIRERINNALGETILARMDQPYDPDRWSWQQHAV